MSATPIAAEDVDDIVENLYQSADLRTVLGILVDLVSKRVESFHDIGGYRYCAVCNAVMYELTGEMAHDSDCPWSAASRLVEDYGR